MGQDYVYPRAIESTARQALASSRVVALLGARQVGKSTLARRLSKDYYTLDSLATRAAAERDPPNFAASLPLGAVIDEVQRVPELLLAIKEIVDLSNAPGRFILTGSSDIFARAKLSESLAGRIRVLDLMPLAKSELYGHGMSFIDLAFSQQSQRPSARAHGEALAATIARGGYPEALRQPDDLQRRLFFASYASSMIQRDLRDISNISDVVAMESLLRLYAIRTATIFSPSAFSRDIGIPKTTLQRYTDVLERAYLIHRLPPWRRDVGRRLTATPKMFLNDTGFALALRGIDSAQLAADPNVLGGLTETLVINELLAQSAWSATPTRLYFYRDQNHLEADVIIENTAGECIVIEVKTTTSPGKRDYEPLRRLADIFGKRFRRGILLYGGTTVIPIAPNIEAIPLSNLWTPPL